MRRANFIIKKKLITTKMVLSLTLTASLLSFTFTFKKNAINFVNHSINTKRAIASVEIKNQATVKALDNSSVNQAPSLKIEVNTKPVLLVENKISKTAVGDEFSVLEEMIKSQKIIGVESFERDKGSKSIRITLNSDTFFKLGTANLDEGSKESIQEIITLLKPISSTSYIEIEGHTDGSPVIKQKVNYPSNWELSAARAASLIPLFSNNGFFKDQMKVIGYGDSRPMFSNHMTNVISAKNRRIVLKVSTQEEEGRI